MTNPLSVSLATIAAPIAVDSKGHMICKHGGHVLIEKKYHFHDAYVECPPKVLVIIQPLCSSTENMVKGLDEDETSFLDEVSRQQSLIEKHRRDEEAQEIKEYRISFCTLKRTQYYCHGS